MEEVVNACAEEAEGKDGEREQEESADLEAALGLSGGVLGLRWSRVCDSDQPFLYSMIVGLAVSS
jgi:hypothetical protein